jgi:hypothetical protein
MCDGPVAGLPACQKLNMKMVSPHKEHTVMVEVFFNVLTEGYLHTEVQKLGIFILVQKIHKVNNKTWFSF